MNEGDYVRIRWGNGLQTISKCKNIVDMGDTQYAKDDFYIHTDHSGEVIYKTMIVKSSPNIIELFEEHDLVVIEYYSLRYKERVTRLFEVDYKDKEFMTIKNAYCDFMLKNNEFNDEDKKLKPIIKSILTKEQFEQMEYKLQ